VAKAVRVVVLRSGLACSVKSVGQENGISEGRR